MFIPLEDCCRMNFSGIRCKDSSRGKDQSNINEQCSHGNSSVNPSERIPVREALRKGKAGSYSVAMMTLEALIRA